MTAVQSRMRDPGLTAAPSVDHATVRVTFEYVTWAQGLPGVFPPLKGSAVVTSPDPTEHIRTVLPALTGKTIGGVTYATPMPAFADRLTDEEVAAVLSYERTSWGNHAPPVKPEDVVARR